MNEPTDQQLLQDYLRTRSEAAFTRIVHRYLDLVYSAALRQVSDCHTAQDVAQSVFVALAQQAPQLTDRSALAGWLHGTARNLAIKTIRTDARRRAREQEAALMTEILSTTPQANWEHIAPHLDEALSELSEPDRDAVLLRYFKNHDLRTVGATLGISDDAAQKRVSRAVDRLREFFAKRGVTVGASGLAVVISANAVQAAPVGLALTISTAAALTGTTFATTATVTATKAIAMTALQKTIVTATIAILAGAGIYEARQAAQLRDQVQTLQQNQAPMAAQIQQLQSERDDATNRVVLLREELGKAKSNNSELLKLRGEVGMLRRELAEVSNAKTTAVIAANEATMTDKPVTNLSAKVDQMKYVLDRMPYLKIPELALATEKQWLLAASCGGDLKTDENYRWAFTQLRAMAEDNFGSLTMRALEKYKQANDGRFPTELSQLQPYYKSPMDTAIFERYEIVPANSLSNSHMDDDWVITTKAPVDRSDFREVIDSRSYGHGSSFYSPQAETINSKTP